MTDIVPVPSFDAVPRLETSTPGEAGPLGALTVQAQVFANRDQHLKEAVDGVRAGVGPGGDPASVREFLGLLSGLVAGAARGAWSTGIAYVTNETVTQGGVEYIARVSHTAGTFASDLAAGKWVVWQGIFQSDFLTKIARTVPTIDDLKGIDKTRHRRAFVLGYYAEGDAGGGPFYLDTADTTSADNGGTIIVASDGGRWKRPFSETIWVDQWGARGDRSTDDSARINAAAAFAASISDFGKCKAVLKFTPRKGYRIAAEHIHLHDYVTYDCEGSEFVGPITGYGRITSATTVPADSDYIGQTSGALMADTDLSDALPDLYTQSIIIKLPSFVNSRFGVVSRRAFCYSSIERPRFYLVDIPVLLYGGVQISSVVDPIFNACCAGVVSVATCFTSNHPWKNKELLFQAGLSITGRGASDTQGVLVSEDVDAWFSAAILRPASNAYRSGFNFGAFTPEHEMGKKVSGWIAYTPARTNNGNQGTAVQNFVTTRCDRGAFYSRNDSALRISNLSAEFYTSGNPAKDDEINSFVVLEDPIDGIIDSVNTEPATPGSVYDKTVKVYRRPSGSLQFDLRQIGRVHARNITGKIDEREFASVTFYDPASDTTRLRNSHSVRRLAVSPAVNWEVVPGLEAVSESFRLRYPLSGNDLDCDAIGYRAWARRIPRSGASNTTTDLILDTGSDLIQDMGGNIIGKLTVHSVRLDTGASDFGQYLVKVPYRYGGSATLAAAASSGDLEIKVTNAYTLYRRGDTVTINGTDKYLIESVAGDFATTAQPLRASYSSGNNVTKTAEIVTTLTAPSGQFALSINATALRITNSLGSSIPIKFAAVIESISPYTFTA